MTLDTDDLTQRLADQVSDVNGSPDLEDLHARVGAVHRRRRRVTGGVTAAFVLALAAGSVVWSTTGDDSPSVSVADTAPDNAPDSTAPVNDAVTRETPFGLLTVKVVPTASQPVNGPPGATCLDGTALQISLDRPDGTSPLGGAAWTLMHPNDGTGPRIGWLTLSTPDGPSLTTIVNAEPGRYRATFADGSTDETTAVSGSIVLVGSADLAATAMPSLDTVETGLSLERLADDGTVIQAWSAADLGSPIEILTDQVVEPSTDHVDASCITLDLGTPDN